MGRSNQLELRIRRRPPRRHRARSCRDRYDNHGTAFAPRGISRFALDSFLPRLREELRLKHRESLGRGLRISLGTHSITTEPFTLLQSDRIHPAYRTLPFNGSASAPVTVNLYAGVSDSAPQDAGWYIFCNGRLILGPDRTTITVWGEGRGRQIPSWHTQFSRFRGFAFFESDDARRLPWTTTKVGVDGIHQFGAQSAGNLSLSLGR